MSLTLEGNGFSYTVPRGIDLTVLGRDTELGAARVIGRRGVVVSDSLTTAGAGTLTLEGRLSAASESALRTAYQGFVEVLESGTLWLTDANLSRTGRVRLVRIASRRAPGPSTSVEVVAMLSLIDGVWQTALTTAKTAVSATITLSTATPRTVRLVIPYAGTAPVRPIIRLDLGQTAGASTEWSDTIRWEGGNLLVNPSFRALFTGVAQSWVVGPGSQPIRDSGRTTTTSLYATANPPAGYAEQTIQVNSDATHTASAYVRADAPSQDATITITWLTAGFVTISSAATTAAATTSWTRIVVTSTAPTTAAHARIRVEFTVGAGYITDVQFEQTASASPFTSHDPISFVRADRLAYVGSYSSDPRYGHRSFVVDMDRGSAELYTSSGTWANDLPNCAPAMFELLPTDTGVQHIYISPPTWYQMAAEVSYRPRYT